MAAMGNARERARLAVALGEFLSSSSDNEDDELTAAIEDHRDNKRPKVINFVERVVSYFDDEARLFLCMDNGTKSCILNASGGIVYFLKKLQPYHRTNHTFNAG